MGLNEWAETLRVDSRIFSLEAAHCFITGLFYALGSDMPWWVVALSALRLSFSISSCRLYFVPCPKFWSRIEIISVKMLHVDNCLL